MHILHALTLGFLSCYTSTWSISAASAQVNGPGPSPASSFDTVVNLPGNGLTFIARNQSIGGVPGQTNQFNISGGNVSSNFTADFGSEVNISSGADVSSTFTAIGSEVNISGGEVGLFFNANSGSVVNITGGEVGGGFDANPGSVINISGGNVAAINGGGFNAFSGSIVNISGGDVGNNFEANSGSVVNVSGGNIGSPFRANFGSQVNISGGIFGANFEAFDGSEVNISGGVFGDNFDVSSGASVNISGSLFLIDGVELNELLPSQAFTITDRDVTLSGLLADGQSFSFDLNSIDATFTETEFFGGIPVESVFDVGDDFFDRGATLTVTLTVPEPSSTGFIAALFALGFARRHRR